jgi:transketolase
MPVLEVQDQLRRLVGDEKHAASAHSTLDVLWVLYDRVLRIDPRHLDDPVRDRFLLSKGHGIAGYYAVLAAKGFFPQEWLDDFAGPASPLGHHPDRMRVPGVEISSGSLGHGLGLGVGVALGLRAQGLPRPRVFVLLGDAELDEGSNHEAIAYAGSAGLGSLTAIVVDNESASLGWPYFTSAGTGDSGKDADEGRGIAARFTANGWSSRIVDGRDHDTIEAGLRAADGARPHVVVARVPGKKG